MDNWQKSAGQDFQKIKGGSPSSYWSKGLERRLEMIKDNINLSEKIILDIGAGLGEFMIKLKEFSPHVYGVEPDKDKVEIALQKGLDVKVSGAESLPFEDNYFDVILLHEVIEHVDDDFQTIKESVRVLKPLGSIVIFCPNRLYPFETHGIYLKGEYHFGNIPLVTYLPFVYKKLTPHVRNYTHRELLSLFNGFNIKVKVDTYVYPGFDSFINKHKNIGPIFKKIMQTLEKTPFKIFGISHFLVVEKL